MKAWLLAFAAITFATLNTACVPTTATGNGTLDNLDTDEDGDGFFELPTKGIEISDTIAIALINTLTRDDLEAVAGQEIPDIIAVTLEKTITRIYEGGEEFVDTGSEVLAPFELRVEAPCPERIIAEINVVASAPLVGTVFEQAFSFTASQVAGEGDVTFTCGTVVTIEAFVNSAGVPDATITVSEQ